jgi:hypothetical protein
MRSILSKLPIVFILAATLLTGVARANLIEVTVDYSNTVGAKIRFDGASHFTFLNATNNFKITTAGVAAGLLGEINGTFTIGNVTTVGKVSSAPVTGVGVFRVHDGHGFDLTGTLQWLNIVQVGTGDFLNTAGSVNLTNITYGGANSVLSWLAQGPRTASDILSFQFNPAKALATLKKTKADTSFSGSIYAERVPEGSDTVLLLGIGLAGLALVRRKRSA